jgi:hypothetical protein
VIDFQRFIAWEKSPYKREKPAMLWEIPPHFALHVACIFATSPHQKRGIDT